MLASLKSNDSYMYYLATIQLGLVSNLRQNQSNRGWTDKKDIVQATHAPHAGVTCLQGQRRCASSTPRVSGYLVGSNKTVSDWILQQMNFPWFFLGWHKGRSSESVMRYRLACHASPLHPAALLHLQCTTCWLVCQPGLSMYWATHVLPCFACTIMISMSFLTFLYFYIFS